MQKAGGELKGVKVVQASDNGGPDSGRGRGEVLEWSQALGGVGGGGFTVTEW